MKAAFLFGSGISRDSGAKTVDQITELALNGGWKSHTDGRFFLESGETAPGSDAARAQSFLHLLKAKLDPHQRVRTGRDCHYEDLYAALTQIVQDEQNEIVNPLIADGAADLQKLSWAIWARQRDHIVGRRFASLADRAADLIQWAVYHGLIEASIPVGMDAIASVARATGDMDIFSLNHDLLIEKHLSDAKIGFADGFGNQRSPDVVLFDRSSWVRQTPGIRLFKLHGSINWYKYEFEGAWEQFARVEKDPAHARDKDGSLLDLKNVQPMFLTGTSVKEQAYGTGLFGDIFTEFRDRLENHRTLICCGYGWGDKGINIRLDQWMRNATDRRLVILHGDPKDELSLRPFWLNRWASHLAAGRLVLVQNWLSKCAVADLGHYFDN